MTKTSTMTHEAIAQALCDNAPLAADQRAALLGLVARDKERQAERDAQIETLQSQLVEARRANAAPAQLPAKGRAAALLAENERLFKQNSFLLECKHAAQRSERELWVRLQEVLAQQIERSAAPCGNTQGRLPIFRLASTEGRARFYNAANHATVKDESTARAAYLNDTGYEATSVNAYTFDELEGTTELADFALYGLG